MALVYSFAITTTTILITPPAGKSIRVLAFYYELANDWTAGDIFSFRHGEISTDDYYPKTTAGAIGMVFTHESAKKNTLPPNEQLVGYISAGGKTVRGTITYVIV